MMMEQANTEVLKEPRGFIRCLQLLLAVVAFATLANYSTQIAISIICKQANAGEEFNQFTRDVTYPFRVEQLEPINVTGLCNITNREPGEIGFLGDFSSEAQFLVFTGVISFLYSLLRYRTFQLHNRTCKFKYFAFQLVCLRVPALNVP